MSETSAPEPPDAEALAGNGADDGLAPVLGLAEEGDWPRAAELLRGMLEARPEDPMVLCWLGVAERELGLDGIAYERFRRCLELGTRDPRVLAVAGSGLAAFDDPDAGAALRSAAVLGPEVLEARWRYGAYLSREGQWDEALTELDAAVELGPDEPVVHLERGVALALAGRVQDAVDAMEVSARLSPGDGWPRALAALLLVVDGRVEDAVADLLIAARLRERDVDLALLASLAAGTTGHDGEAFELLETARMMGADAASLDEVEEALDDGPEAARLLLVEELGPHALRARLMERP